MEIIWCTVSYVHYTMYNRVYSVLHFITSIDVIQALILRNTMKGTAYSVRRTLYDIQCTHSYTHILYTIFYYCTPYIQLNSYSVQSTLECTMYRCILYIDIWDHILGYSDQYILYVMRCTTTTNVLLCTVYTV